MSRDARRALFSALAIMAVGITSGVLATTGGETTGGEALVILIVFVVCMSVVITLGIASYRDGAR